MSHLLRFEQNSVLSVFFNRYSRVCQTRTWSDWNIWLFTQFSRGYYLWDSQTFSFSDLDNLKPLFNKDEAMQRKLCKLMKRQYQHLWRMTCRSRSPFLDLIYMITPVVGVPNCALFSFRSCWFKKGWKPLTWGRERSYFRIHEEIPKVSQTFSRLYNLTNVNICTRSQTSPRNVTSSPKAVAFQLRLGINQVPPKSSAEHDPTKPHWDHRVLCSSLSTCGTLLTDRAEIRLWRGKLGPGKTTIPISTPVKFPKVLNIEMGLWVEGSWCHQETYSQKSNERNGTFQECFLWDVFVGNVWCLSFYFNPLL